MIKRLFDLLLAGGVLLLTWPLILLAALAVKLTSPGPAFYRAQRAGLGGQPFHMFKLRTMVTGADSPDRRVTAARDERITPLGRLLRRLKLDELPQFWNVLRGDMSVVGPRPEDWHIVQRHYTPEQRRILAVRPGLVSPVEVLWYPDLTYHDPPPANVPIQDWYIKRHLPAQVAAGLDYLDRQSLRLDLKIILQTIVCLLVHPWRPPQKRPLETIPPPPKPSPPPGAQEGQPSPPPGGQGGQ